MRTTLTIDPDVEAKLKRKMAKEKVSLKQAVNDTLRAGFSHAPAQVSKFVVKPKAMGVMPGIDYDKLNQFLDERDVEEYLKKHAK